MAGMMMRWSLRRNAERELSFIESTTVASSFEGSASRRETGKQSEQRHRSTCSRSRADLTNGEA